MEDNLKEYIVRPGKTFGVDGKKEGESVFLTDSEAAAFLDLVELRVKPRKGESSGAETAATTGTVKSSQKK